MPTNNYHDVTFSFSTPVVNLSFQVADLDTSGSGLIFTSYDYWDQVAITNTGGASFGSSIGADLSGAGSLTNPWRQTNFSNSDSGVNDAAHRVTVTFTDPVTSFTIRYWTSRGRSAYNGAQAIWLGNMTYKVNCV